jgi:hypothetical protein
MYSKIQNLLEQAAAQAESSTAEVSSVTNATRSCSSETEAKNVFQRLIQKLFNIEQWNAESNLSSFALFDENGFAKMEKIAAVGDFIRITLPGSGKNDWVKIVEIHDAADEIVLTVQPSSNPTDKEDNSTTSHFFTNDSTNNFCLQKNGIKLNFYVIGLGEKSNTEDTSGIVETVRNFATANIGHFLGIQKAQWQNFCDNFVEIEK